MINFYPDIDISDDDKSYILECLPTTWETDVKYVFPKDDMEITIKINAKTAEEAYNWLLDFQHKTKTTYSVNNTRKCTGEKLIFKKRFNCHHRTRRKETHDPILRQRVKNTNCPSNLTIRIRVTGKRYRGKNQKDAPDPDKPCEIKLKLNHNHSLTDGIGPMFKRVSSEIKDKLIALYQQGHSASTALVRIKTDIKLNNKNYTEILADRSQCPDYRFCHYIYEKYISKSSNGLILNERFLENKIDKYNKAMNEECAKMTITNSGFVICICPPFVKRIHKFNPSSVNLVFIHSITICNKVGSKIYILLTNSEIGALPLGIILSTSDSQNNNYIGFLLLKEMLGNSAFGGNTEGPKYFIIDEHLAEQNFINNLWPNSKILYGMSYTLQNIWKWLASGKNQINIEDRIILFTDFYNMMFANTEHEFMIKYHISKENGRNYNNYINILNDYYEQRHLWAMYYRKNIFSSDIEYSETCLRIIRSSDLKWFKSWSIFQIIDFIIHNFFQLFEQRLLNTVNTGVVNCILQEKIAMPPIEILQKIKILSDKIQLVPSDKSNELIYCVNTDTLSCTCFNGIGVLCKHVQWMCLLLHEDIFCEKIINLLEIRNNFLQILNLPTDEEMSHIEIIETDNSEASNILNIINIPLNKKQNHDIKNQFLLENAIIVKVENDIDNIFEITENKNEIIDEGKELWQKMTNIFENFLKESPEEIVTATKQMLNKFENIKNVKQMISALQSFGPKHRKIASKHEAENLLMLSTNNTEQSIIVDAEDLILSDQTETNNIVFISSDLETSNKKFKLINM